MNSGHSCGPMAGGLRRSCLCTLSAIILSLYGCGGGSSGGGTTSPPDTGQNSGPTVSLTSSVSSIATSAATNEGAPLLPNPVSFTIPASGTYYYQLSFQGTAIAKVAMNGVAATVYNTDNSSIGSVPALGYDIGATIHGSWSGTQLGINDIYVI